MTRRSRIWLIIAWLFTLGNLGGAVFAARTNEELHAAVHVALALVGAVFVWSIPRRARHQQLPGTNDEMDRRLERLQQSVDAVAIEVERIGEAQRFTAKLAAEIGKKPSPEAAPLPRRPNEEQ
jgi:hypothetical protein